MSLAGVVHAAGLVAHGIGVGFAGFKAVGGGGSCLGVGGASPFPHAGQAASLCPAVSACFIPRDVHCRLMICTGRAVGSRPNPARSARPAAGKLMAAAGALGCRGPQFACKAANLSDGDFRPIHPETVDRHAVAGLCK